MGAPHTSADAVHEVKVGSPCKYTYKAGNGGKYGGTVKHVGDFFGFGSTEEEFRWQNLGCKAKGLKDGPALNHSTGKGWVDGFSAPNPAATSLQRQAGADYHDAIYVKNNRVYLWVCECFGGICPAGDAELKRM